MNEAMTKVTTPGYSRRLKKEWNELPPEFRQPTVGSALNPGRLQPPAVPRSLSSLRTAHPLHQNATVKGDTKPRAPHVGHQGFRTQFQAMERHLMPSTKIEEEELLQKPEGKWGGQGQGSDSLLSKELAEGLVLSDTEHDLAVQIHKYSSQEPTANPEGCTSHRNDTLTSRS